MRDDLRYALLFYKYGEFVADVILAGMIHPDMQFSNIGFDSFGNFKFCDYSEIERINIPDELLPDRIRQLTESLFPIIDEAKKSFLNISYFRIGFISNGGMLASELFANMLNNGFSSSLYANHKFTAHNYKPLTLLDSIKDAIREWKNTDVKSVNLENYRTLQSYNDSEVRNKISLINRFYLDYRYLTRALLAFKDREELKAPSSSVLLNLSLLSANFGKMYTEYGMLKKCLSLDIEIKQIEEICKKRIISLLTSEKCSMEIVGYIDTVIDKYDLFELLWILDDIDKYSLSAAKE